MKTTVLLPGTLCDERVFGALPQHLAQPLALDYSAWADTRTAAAALLSKVPAGSIGIAFSLGSWVLLEMLRLAPKRFAGIILVSGNAYPDAPENAKMRRDRVALARAEGFSALFADDWPKMLGHKHRDDPALRRLIVAMAEHAGHESHARQAEANISRPDHRQYASASPIPVHVIAGTEDGLCPRERYEAAANGPGSSLTMVADTGHYLPLEAPVALRSLINARFPEYFI